MNAWSSLAELAFWALVVFAAALAGAAFTRAGVSTWYVALKKPRFNPPAWVFGPVWTALYALMAISMWLVRRKAGADEAVLPAALFIAQLALNVLWTAIFFALRRPAAALAEILVLWLVILAALLSFGRVSPLAGVLLAPYLAWVSFAALLNYRLWRINR